MKNLPNILLTLNILSVLLQAQPYAFDDFVGMWEGNIISVVINYNDPTQFTIEEDGFYTETSGHLMPTIYPNTQMCEYEASTNRFHFWYLKTVYAGMRFYQHFYYEVVRFDQDTLEMHYNYWDDPEPHPEVTTIILVKNSVTPVELISFFGESNKGEVQLKWQTATETNNLGFEIERNSTSLSMTHGVTPGRVEGWETIGFIEGKGTTSEMTNYRFVDSTLPAEKMFYRLKQIDINGTFTYSNIVEVELESNLPTEYSLEQNYPNPFNPTTTIKFGLPESAKVVLEVYNVVGERVSTLVNVEMEAGYHQVNFNANNMASGMYIYRIKSNEFIQTKKLLLLK